jgi:hypothetical protein
MRTYHTHPAHLTPFPLAWRDIADSFRVYKLKTGIFAAADSNKEA